MADSGNGATKTYVATTVFLNILCVALIPLGLFFAHAGDPTRQLAFVAFTVLSIACFCMLARNFVREKRFRMAVFVVASFVAMLVVSWLCIWPDFPEAWMPITNPSESIVTSPKHYGPGGSRLLIYFFLAWVIVSYLLLFLPVMIAGAAGRYSSQSRSAIARRLK